MNTKLWTAVISLTIDLSLWLLAVRSLQLQIYAVWGPDLPPWASVAESVLWGCLGYLASTYYYHRASWLRSLLRR